ncbi:MAG: hypothetical protein HY907_08915 [Deltaproteobacteria bacterium]|nr:hypothetical protein [Deltaproteobacteria bacterium]
MTRKTWWTTIAALALITIGCADERDAVDRVQPFALDKTFFVGADFQDASDDPEFWTQATIIDVGYGATQDGVFTSTWVQPVARIRWQITEDLLLGRLAYERIDNADGKGAGRPVQDGVVVVAYPIESHFDIVRQYNPTTGEQINVLEENSWDRPWNERQYMRVDWSHNMNTDSYDFDMLSMLGILGGYEFTPIDYDITDPDDPNAPVFDLEHGYFDVTNKAFAQPQVIDISSFGWGLAALPACWLDGDFMGGSFPFGNCNPSELTVRQSFRRVEDRDFQPKEWDGYRFQAFGGFYMDRFGYARNYGMSDDLWHRLLSHHNIWERSHYYADSAAMTGAIPCYTPETTPFGGDAHRDSDPRDGTEDECAAAGEGSKCDVLTQKCTLPYAQRTPRTLAWYYAEGSNPEYFEGTANAAHHWDVGLRAAVRSAQYAECMATGGDQEACVARFPIWFGQMDDYQDAIWLADEVDKCRNGWAYAGEDCDELADDLGADRGFDPGVISVAQMDEMIVLCHSPVEAGDPEACGGPRLPAATTAAQCQHAYRDAAADDQLVATCRAALNVRRGDMRYNQVNGIWDPQSYSPWGIYADSVDPLTGEVIATSINVWTHVNDLASQDAIDKIRFLAGELDAEDVTEGEYVHNWSQAAETASRGGVLPLMSRADLADRLARFGGVDGASEVPATLPPDVLRDVRDINRALQGVRASVGAPTSTSAIYNARRQAARGTHFEAELMTPMVQEYRGVDGLPIDQAVLDVASPLRGGNAEIHQQWTQMVEEALARRGACILQPGEAEMPFSLIGLADVLQEKFGNFDRHDSVAVQQDRAERMRKYIAQRLHMSVISHEMGHSMALRHNFVGTSDAYMYRPQYWQLRTRNGTVTEPCTELTTDGRSCVGPRWFDPVTDEERDNLIWMWSIGSIMDYPGELTQDMMGPNIWDFAAARMVYGETVAVNPDAESNVGTFRGRAMLDKMDNFGGIIGIRWSLPDDVATSNDDFHYSQLQAKIGMISDCRDVDDPELWKPEDWDDAKGGAWSPLFDGLIVKVDGRYSRCKQPRVDYVPWTEQRFPTIGEAGQYYRGGPSIDHAGRTRVPYGFGTDSWADLGNVSVYRHDNGADPYEIFNFLLTSQEVWQIFETYRRHKSTFTVSGAADRILGRYSAKVRDGAKGLGLIKNIYEDYALEDGTHFGTLWPYIVTFWPENVVAAGLAFDHFVRQAARPEIGPHFFRPWENFLRSSRDTVDTPGGTKVIVPNGIAGVAGGSCHGGKLVENLLSEDHGEFDTWYTINAGSYYDKMNVAMLMTESVDNFISSTRNDFVDPRYRAVSMADLFPDGYRRWIANALTGDEEIKGPRVIADADGDPIVDFEKYSEGPIGWTSWWTTEPQVCFAAEQTNVCSSYHMPTSDPFHPLAPEHTAVLDPQIGWEQQKFLIAWTMLFLFENEEMNWLDLMRVYEKGTDPNPDLRQYLEFHSPDGKVYVAQTFGTEVIFGKTVQKGIAARVLEWANELLAQAYVTEVPDADGDTLPDNDLDGDGDGDWPELVYAPGTGQPIVQWDPNTRYVASDGSEHPEGIPGCNMTENYACDCSSNHACMALQRYLSIPAYLREAVYAYQLGDPDRRGIWD